MTELMEAPAPAPAPVIPPRSPETVETAEVEKPPTANNRLKQLTERFFQGKEDLLPEERGSRADLLQYRPDSSKFREPKIAGNFFHPIDHLARTLIWSDIFVNMLPKDQQESIDRRVLRIASVLHDVGRGEGVLANRDPHMHGAVAAEDIRDRKRLHELLPEAQTENLTDEQVEDIAYLVENHHHFDHEKAEIRPEMELALNVLQAADGIDLARGYFALGGPLAFISDRSRLIDRFFPIVGHTLAKQRIPEVRMHIPHIKKLIPLASRFATQTQWEITHPPKEELLLPKDGFSATLDIAQEMELIKP